MHGTAGEANPTTKPRGGSRKKRDAAPRGVRRHPSGVWAIRYCCEVSCVHKERIGPLKGDAIRAYHDRRRRAHEEPGWCPSVERQRQQEQAEAAQVREAKRVTFGQYAQEYLAWAKLHHRGWRTEESRVNAMVEAFKDAKLDAMATVDVERFLDNLLATRSGATRNRYRTTLHAMFNRALRHGLLTVNPVRGITKARESEGRTLYLTPDEEAAIRDQLRPDAMGSGTAILDARRGDLRPLFTVSVHTGLRWSEQRRLGWRDVDFLTGLLTVRQTKSGYSRDVPMNSIVRSVLLDVASQRRESENPKSPCSAAPTSSQTSSFRRRLSGSGCATASGKGRIPARRLHLALQPAYVRLTTRHGTS